jgi:hypothetical protein
MKEDTKCLGVRSGEEAKREKYVQRSTLLPQNHKSPNQKTIRRKGRLQIFCGFLLLRSVEASFIVFFLTLHTFTQQVATIVICSACGYVALSDTRSAY